MWEQSSGLNKATKPSANLLPSRIWSTLWLQLLAQVKLTCEACGAMLSPTMLVSMFVIWKAMGTDLFHKLVNVAMCCEP